MALAPTSPMTTLTKTASVAPAPTPAPAAPVARQFGPHASIAQPPTNVDQYYATAQGKQGADLIHSLGMIVRSGHIDSGYAQARDGLFSLVADHNHTGTVTELYTGRQVSGISDRKTAYSAGLNTEHTWPQSMGATGIAQSDLHQLQPADIQINGLRGSLGYGDVTQVDWKSGDGPRNTISVKGTDATGTEVFEPRDAVKGDIARGLLYFYTRYNESRPSGYADQTFFHALPTLVKWTKLDPVDDAERQRNEDVFSLQHNRNPYIDHPEWIDAAGFATLKR